MISNPDFPRQRQAALAGLKNAVIDPPIVRLIENVNSLPHCFTLQCCYGHFVYPGQDDPHGIIPLPSKAIEDDIEYRIAYIAFCFENNHKGHKLLSDLKELTALDPDNIQFSCAEWFWNQQANSYVIEVEPDRFKYQDTAIIGYEEALAIEKVRNRLFIILEKMFSK